MPRIATYAAVLLAAAAPLFAHDPWEEADNDDSATTTFNVLRHGVVQRHHDLDASFVTPDVDWMRVMVTDRHSYEARVSGIYWDDGCVSFTCPRFDRVLASGVVATPSVQSDEDVEAGEFSIGRTVRWIASDGSGQNYLRAIGPQGSALGALVYDVVFYDTTLFVPRFNNSATQTTVLLLQNTTGATVAGSVYFHDAAGALLATHAFSIPQHGLASVQTAAIPSLAGRSGSAQVAHTGGYAALTGKAVALEPATGFTFDTAVTPVPR